MNKLKHTGIKISDYPSSITNVNDFPHKLEHNHYFISYAPTYFGTSTINKNYKIPLQMLRQDQKFFIGLNNAKGDWQNLLTIWSGDWFNENKTESYVYQWDYDERGSVDYVKNKFGLEEDEDKIDRIFFVKNAPIPMEEEHEDPNPESNKFVNKKYIDDRFNGIRKISVSQEYENGELFIRPYSCVYEYSETPTIINITDTKQLQDGRLVKEFLQNNILTFIVKFPVPVEDDAKLTILANGKPNIKWSYPTEFGDVLSAARKNENSDVWLECFSGYVGGELCIRCSNALNPMPGSEKALETVDEVTQGVFDKVPTSDAVYNFTIKNAIPKIEEIEEGKHISVDTTKSDENYINPTPKKVKISVITSSTVTDTTETIPNSKAVHDFVVEQINEYKVKTSDSIEDSIKNNTPDDIPTSGAVNDFVLDKFENLDKDIEKWHNDKDYTHISSDIYTGVGNLADNTSYGDAARGVIIKMPETCKVSKIVIGGVASYNTEYNFFAKITDAITDKKIAVVQGNPADHSCVSFDFSDGAYLIKNRNYKLTFHKNENSTTADQEFYVAYGNAESQTSDGTYDLGKYIPEIITSDGSIKKAPSSWKASSGTTYNCNGYKALVEYNNVRNQEFIDITDEISNIYDALGQTDAASADSLRNLTENFNAHIEDYENHITDFNNHLTTLEEHVEEFGNHIGNTLDYVQHVTLTDKNNWNSKINEVLAGDFITVTNKDTVSVNTSSIISNDDTTVPTSQVIYNHSKDINASNDTDSVHLTKKQKTTLYEPVESYKTDIDDIFNPESQNNYVGCIAFVTNEITKSTTVDLKVNSFKFAGMFKPADGDNNHIVVSKKLCIWECNDNNRVNTATVSNPIVLSQIVNADPESNDSDGYQVTYHLAKYATFKAGKVYFITFHSEDYEPPTSAASHQKCQLVADYVNRYNESGSNGIYYVNYSSDKLFSYDSINYNYTLRVVLNSNKEIEHVVTDKNLESYLEELLYNSNSDISKIAYLKNDSIDYENQIGEGEPPAGGRADTKSIHLSKSHFLGDTLGRITKIEIPRPNSAGSGTSRDAAYLAVQLFKNDEAISNIIYSDNTQSYSDGGSYIFNFDWNKLILIDYDIIKLSFVRSKDEIINQNTFIPSGGYTFRVIVWTSDDDACVVYDGGGVRYDNWGIKIKASIEDTNNSTKQVHTLDMHITPELRNYISYLESRISNLEHLLATNS